MKLKNDAECQSLDDDNFELLYSECQARKAYDIVKPEDGYCRYDAIIDKRIRVEIKRRPCTSDQYPDYFMRKEKIDTLRGMAGDCFGVFFFTDCWFVFDLRQEFPTRRSFVDNPAKGSRYEINYVIKPSQGRFYTYRTTPLPWENK